MIASHTVVSADAAGNVLFHAVPFTEKPRTVALEQPVGALSLATIHSYPTVAIGYGEHTVGTWDAHGEQLCEVEADPQTPSLGSAARRGILVTSQSHSLQLRDPRTGKKRQSQNQYSIRHHEDRSTVVGGNNLLPCPIIDTAVGTLGRMNFVFAGHDLGVLTIHKLTKRRGRFDINGGIALEIISEIFREDECRYVGQIYWDNDDEAKTIVDVTENCLTVGSPTRLYCGSNLRFWKNRELYTKHPGTILRQTSVGRLGGKRIIAGLWQVEGSTEITFADIDSNQDPTVISIPDARSLWIGSLAGRDCVLIGHENGLITRRDPFTGANCEDIKTHDAPVVKLAAV